MALIRARVNGVGGRKTPVIIRTDKVPEGFSEKKLLQKCQNVRTNISFLAKVVEVILEVISIEID